tara:strand:+ start:17362 stop:18381 length:1020 start_codon:yes stop_codon:yes gene_type:complete
MKKLLSKAFIIAEIGVNHNGDMSLARDMIDQACNSGADAVKFQTYKTERLVSKETPKVSYQENNTKKNETHFDMLKKLELTEENHFLLYSYSKEKKIEFISTPYDVEDAKFLFNLGINTFKTASADIVDFPLHDYLSKINKDVIISTGMATKEEVIEVMSFYKKKINKPYLLHCISNYPCLDKNINLNVINFLKSINGERVGFSDHSVGNFASIGAITMGAKVIEKHFTLDKNLDGPDHKASSTPSEFKSLVNDIRKMEKLMGSENKIVYEEEMQMRKVSRKSLFFKKNIKANTIIGIEHLTLKRPGTGIYSTYIKDVIGKKAKQDVFKDEIVTFEKIY